MASEKRLIDANALLRHKRKMSGADFGGEFWDEAVLASDIKNAPTVDAVEVVYCKDCVRYKNGFCMIRKDSWGETLEVGLHDFCSDGERRSDEAK